MTAAAELAKPKSKSKRPTLSPTFASSENPNYVPPPPVSRAAKRSAPAIPWQDREIPLDTMTISPLNRRHLTAADKKAIDSLADSIRAVGVIEPILVRPAITAGYELLAGRRRYEAAKLAGLTLIPVRFADIDDVVASQIVTIENLQRENLSPLEEGEQIQTMLNAGHTIADAAARLGQTEYWISTRAKLTELSPAWQKSMLDPNGILTHWTTAHLVEIAKLPASTQEELAKEALSDADWEAQEYWVMSATALRGYIAKTILLKLSTAPWKLDDAALVPAAGACSTCPKRTAAAPVLWPDLIDPGIDRCTDAACFSGKSAALVAIKEAELKTKTGVAPLKIVNNTWEHRKGDKVPAGIVSDYEYAKVKQSTPGAKPAIYAEGPKTGEIVYVKKHSDSFSAGSKNRSSAAEPAEKSMAVKRKELERKRKARAVDLFRTALDDEDFESTKMGHFQLVKLAAVFGTADKKPYITDYGSNADGFAWKGFDQIKTEASAHQCLWEQVRGVFQDRLKIIGPVTTSEAAERAWSEACKLAALIDLKAQHYLDEATAEIKEPKSWATAFGTGNGPKKTNKLKQRG